MAFSVLGETLCIEGCIGSYGEKTAIEKAAKEAGFREIDNCVRIIPGLAAGARAN